MNMLKRITSSHHWLVPALAVLFFASCAGKPQEGLGVYPKAMGAADEGFAIQALRMIATAQAQAKVGRGSYSDFDGLVQSGYLDSRFAGATPNLKGYLFTMTAGENQYSVNADPQTTQTQPTTGVRHFYMDSNDSAIHVNPTQTAQKTDPLL